MNFQCSRLLIFTYGPFFHFFSKKSLEHVPVRKQAFTKPHKTNQSYVCFSISLLTGGLLSLVRVSLAYPMDGRRPPHPCSRFLSPTPEFRAPIGVLASEYKESEMKNANRKYRHVNKSKNQRSNELIKSSRSYFENNLVD